MFEWFRSSLVLLEFIYKLFNCNLLNARMQNLQGYMKVNFKASQTRLNYVEFATKGSLLLTLIL